MKEVKKKICPDCEATEIVGLDRRDFLKTVGTAAAVAATSTLPVWAVPKAAAATVFRGEAETAAKALYESLSEAQRKEICFAWDYVDPERGLLRTRVSNNWQITKPHI